MITSKLPRTVTVSTLVIPEFTEIARQLNWTPEVLLSDLARTWTQEMLKNPSLLKSIRVEHAGPYDQECGKIGRAHV